MILTFVPLACVAMAGLGLVLGTSFEPRNLVVLAFAVAFLTIGLRNFRRRVLS